MCSYNLHRVLYAIGVCKLKIASIHSRVCNYNLQRNVGVGKLDLCEVCRQKLAWRRCSPDLNSRALKWPYPASSSTFFFYICIILGWLLFRSIFYRAYIREIRGKMNEENLSNNTWTCTFFDYRLMMRIVTSQPDALITFSKLPLSFYIQCPSLPI